jgi:hypothetical protein
MHVNGLVTTANKGKTGRFLKFTGSFAQNTVNASLKGLSALVYRIFTLIQE